MRNEKKTHTHTAHARVFIEVLAETRALKTRYAAV